MANQVDSPKNPGFYGGLVAKAAPLAWGMALCALVTLVAVTIQALEETLVGHPYVEAIVIAILLGTAIRTLWERQIYCRRSCANCSRRHRPNLGARA